MTRMIIADDESVIIRGLERILDWESMGIEIVGKFTDGSSALNGILALRPDIALLDISMPHLSGIEVLEKVREMGIPVSVIFISGFQDFEYVQAALHHGASDYLLKPLIRSEISAAITRCLPYSADLHDPDSGVDANDEMPSSPFIAAAILPSAVGTSPLETLRRFSASEKAEELVTEDRGCRIVRRHGGAFAVISGKGITEAEDFLRGIASEVAISTGVPVLFTLSDPVPDRESLDKAIAGCSRMPEAGFFFSGVIQSDLLQESIELSRLPELREELLSSLLGQKRDVFDAAAEAMVSAIPAFSGYRKSEACFCFCSTLRYLYERLEAIRVDGSEAEDLKLIMENGMKESDWASLSAYFISVLSDLYSSVTHTILESGRKDFLIALDYIEKHYMEPIGLKSVADQIGMNTYYFSSYFKKNTGINFKDFLRKTRMQHALEMLLATDTSIKEVAAAVGIIDVRTFSELFQKTYGEKPSAYIRRVRSAE